MILFVHENETEQSLKKLFKYLIVSIITLICQACIEYYDPGITRYEDVLVIDGILTDDPESSVVRLSRSFHYNAVREEPESGATVLIKDDLENVVSLYEADFGVYRSDDPEFRAIAGRSYRLHVITKDEQTYESDFVEFKKVPEIEKVYAEFALNTEGEDIEYGFQIYVDTYDPENETCFYRYEYEETWEFAVPYPSRYEVVNNEMVPRLENVHHCWKTVNSTDILIVNNEKMESDIIRKLPVHFVSVNGSQLSIIYSILVKQYAMSREAYTFWDQLKISNQARGGLFDVQPMQTISNIYSTNDPGSPVIGFFEAASVAKKRIFLTRSDIPKGFTVETEFDDCRKKYHIVPLDIFDLSRYRGYCIVNYDSDAHIMSGMGIIIDFKCCDCTVSGSNIRPDFW
jgi:hypothetical protein